jgi:hypothetical protein
MYDDVRSEEMLLDHDGLLAPDVSDPHTKSLNRRCREALC